METATNIQTKCCIAGGGPAGMMLGFLLARMGVEVVVLEKHADFLRDFRGDTIHPSTLEVMHELGILEEFLERPHSKVFQAAGQVGDELITIVDFSHLPTKCKFIVFMPQWDFLDFIADHGSLYPSFNLKMRAEVDELIEEGNRVVGVKARTSEGLLEIRADLVVGADGRSSIVRERAGLDVEELGAPIDVLWFRLSRLPDDPGQVLGRVVAGKIMVMLNRDTYWQCGYIIAKGALDKLKQRGLEAFRADILSLAAFLGDRVGEIHDWDEIKLLRVQVDRLRKWYRPGLLCIGDATHAMSPVGGVGINLAIQDAVAASNLLTAPLRDGRLTTEDLCRVQQRQEWPTRMTQRVQLMIQNRVIKRTLSGSD